MFTHDKRLIVGKLSSIDTQGCFTINGYDGYANNGISGKTLNKFSGKMVIAKIRATSKLSYETCELVMQRFVLVDIKLLSDFDNHGESDLFIDSDCRSWETEDLEDEITENKGNIIL